MEADSENFPAPNIETLEPCSKETLESHHEETTNMESANIFNFEVSDSLRESIFSSLAQTSLIDAADFEFRTHPSFLKILNEIDGTCRSDLLEKSKLVSLRLSLTRATLFGQLGTAFNTHPVSFKQVAFYSSRSPISDICEAMQAFFQGNSVTEYSLFVEVEDKDFSEILESIAALFRKTSNLTFLYIELDPFLPPKNWNALLQSFQVLASLKYFAMKSLFISNEQLLRLFRLLNKLSTNVICAILDRQWFKENFSNVLQFCQRKKIELKAQFRELSLHLQSDSAMPFTPIWKISLTNLNIGFNNIDTEGAKYLSEALRENTTLTGLNIGWNNIGTEGAKYLSEALRENTTLTILDIDGNNIGTEGAKYLSGALRENTTLTTLDINHTCIGTEGAEYLSKALRENTTLTTLDISYNNIGTEGAKYLSEALRENTTLTSLDIGWNNIGTECAKYLSEALRENTTLTSFDIDHNKICTEGAKFIVEISKYLNRNISKRNGENISNASVVTAPAANSTLKLDPQRMRNSLEYLISVDQTFIVYRYTHLKESTLLFILYMQSRRMQMHLFPSVSYCLYSPLANMNYFILDDSKHMEMRKEPHYFEPNQFTCVICHNICISPYASENCIHAFCQTCIEQWGQKSCPTCRTACKEWKPSVLVEHLILQLQLQCPFECGWKGTFSEYNTSHQLKCPNKVGKCSLCHLPMKQLEFFDLHYRNCHYGLVPCDYCHHDVPFPLLAAHVAHECVLAPSTCGACGYCFSTWQSMISHVDNECVKVVEKCRYYDCGCTKYIERGLLSKHELEAMKEHVYLVKQNMTVRQDKVTEGRTKRRKAGLIDEKTGRLVHRFFE
eukprot:jgi/Galph1/5155/GphlegSOOS_G3753.1